MKYLSLFFCLVLFACQNAPKKVEETTTHKVAGNYPQDVHSFANPNEAVVKHLSLYLTADFKQKILKGMAILNIEHDTSAKQLILDTKDLKISKVMLKNESKGEDSIVLAQFQLGKKDSILGTSLTIPLKHNTKAVAVYYETSPEAEALQWLEPQQTADKKHPVLLTQSQAINARSWIPIQDMPGVRFTYDATIHVPTNLIALMSATNPQQKNDSGTYIFKMPQQVPAYLMALAVGNYHFAKISERAGVYAEPSVLAGARKELEDTEQMIGLAEKLYGRYLWERYDVIILPPSFPFGGMENPRLTFATPTILVGDKSQVTLIAHELAHSWSGNLVTNATWDDFWLNEGFTVYFEQRIMEALKGRDYSEILAQRCMDDLNIELENLKEQPEDTRLKISLKGRNPDDGVTDIAYCKGYFFLRLIEETVGREKWDTFLKDYFTTYQFQSMTTEKFIEKLAGFLSKAEMDKIGVNAWIYEKGLPKNCPVPVPTKLTEIDKQLAQSKGDWAKINAKSWTTYEYLYFIEHLPTELNAKQCAELDKVFHFSESNNSEIQCKWYQVAIKCKYEAAYTYIEKFLVNVGRRKFLTPLYKEMCKTTEGKAMAKRIYAQARPNYHPISQHTIDEMLK
ncbi:MAG: M1 family metallopeptidase [Bacteroidia bacterium]